MKITSQEFAAAAALITAGVTVLIWKQRENVTVVSDGGQTAMAQFTSPPTAEPVAETSLQSPPIDLGDINIGGNQTVVGGIGNSSGCNCNSCPSPVPFKSPLQNYPITQMPLNEQASIVESAQPTSSPTWSFVDSSAPQPTTNLWG